MTLLSDVLLGNVEGARVRLAAGESTEVERESPVWSPLAPRPGTPTGRPTLLHVAAETNDRADVARLLLDAGFAVDARDTVGSTPLHIAAFSNHLATARLLLERGADANAEDCAGYAAIDHAKDYDLVELLLAHGAAPDGGARIEWPFNRYEGWPLIEQLASFGKTPLPRLFLDAGADLAKHPRALAIACARGHDEMVSLLLERGADPTSALHDVAIASDKYLRILLEHGADPNVRNASGETPLAVVVKRGLDRAARLLVDRGANVHVRASDGASLYEAARRAYDAGLSDARVVMQLLEGAGAGPARVAKAPEPTVPSGPAVGARVTHAKFGAGAITKVDGEKLEVSFESGEKKTLLAKFLQFV